MAQSGPGAANFADLRNRVLFVVGALIVFRIGSHIPIAGIDISALRAEFAQAAGGLLNLLNFFSGGSIGRLSVLTLGIIPYITSSIIMNLASYSIPALEQLKKEGTAGRRKLTSYTRYGTVVLAAMQAYILAVSLERLPGGLVLEPGLAFKLTTVLMIVAGTVFLMWLGEQITERGIGNGISILIFASIVSGLPQAVAELAGQVQSGAINPLTAMLITLISLVLVAGVVFVERGQRRIPLNYAKRQVGNRLMGGQRSHLPLKVNMAGVMPAIFAYALVFFPTQIVLLSSEGGSEWLRDLAAVLSRGQPLYLVMLAAILVFFTFFYTSLVHNPRETADLLRRSGAFVPGIRPGEQTARYLGKVVMRLTLAAACYISFVCLLPELMVFRFAGTLTNFVIAFGGTALLIMVVVSMDFMEQVQHYMLTQQYGSLLKKVPGGGRLGT